MNSLKTSTPAVGSHHVPKQYAPQLQRALDPSPRPLSRENALRIVRKLRSMGACTYKRATRTVEFETFMEPAVLALGTTQTNHIFAA